METLFKETIIPEETIKDILSLLNKYNFKDISNESCTKNGYQTSNIVEHDHKKTEKYSFILYLNNSDGDTVFKEPVNKKITPKLGKLIFFDSDISHRAEISNEGKQVLVGAIDEKTQISKK